MQSRLMSAVLGLGCLGVLGAMLAPALVEGQVDAADSLAADDSKTWKSIASDKDLASVLKNQIDDIKKSSKSKALFTRNAAKLSRSGYLVALIGNIGTLTLEGADAGKSAALREAGITLAKAAKKKNYADSEKAIKQIEQYPSSIAPAADAKPGKWVQVLPIDPLMKWVSSIDTATRNATKKAGSEKEFKDRALDSTILAWLAVVAREHNENKDWKGWCDDMRANSLLMSKEFGAKNLEGTKKANSEVQKSCTSCHDVYRKDE